MKTFDTSYARRDTERRARHGLKWEPSELNELRELYQMGVNLGQMCAALERPADGVISKLQQLKLINFDTREMAYIRNPKVKFFDPSIPVTVLVNPTPKEPEMKAPTIETKTFIHGSDASQMTDVQIFTEIAKIEGEIDSLKKIKAKSSKLTAYVSTLTKAIEDLVAYVDSRGEKA